MKTSKPNRGQDLIKEISLKQINFDLIDRELLRLYKIQGKTWMVSQNTIRSTRHSENGHALKEYHDGFHFLSAQNWRTYSTFFWGNLWKLIIWFIGDMTWWIALLICYTSYSRYFCIYFIAINRNRQHFTSTAIIWNLLA